MKNSRKILTLAAALGCGCTLLTSCKLFHKKAIEGGEQTLRIYITKAGYDVEWVKLMVEEFKNADWVKEKYPNLVVAEPFTNSNQEFVQNAFDGGERNNNYDLLFGLNLFDRVSKNQFLDLTDVLYDAEVPGTGGQKYKERMYPSYVESMRYNTAAADSRNGHFFLAPWAGGNVSFLYNPVLLQNLGKEVPVTTDELISCFDAYTLANYKGTSTTSYAFLKGKDEDYINKLFYTWWAQYQGIEGYENFWSGIDDGTISKDIFKQKGRLESLKVFDALFNPDKHNVGPSSYLNDFLANQKAFKGGGSLFYANGDWYPSEMKGKAGIGGNYEAKMMRAPIISAIRENTPTIADDAELSALVKAIDREETALTGTGYDVSQDDYNIVKEARRVVWSFGSGHTAVIPTYALGKNVAVDFLKFMATDKGLETYMKGTMGASLPFKYDLKTKNPTLYNSSEIDPLHKERLDYMNSEFLQPYTLRLSTSYPLASFGWVTEWASSYSLNYFDYFSNANYRGASFNTPQKYYDGTIAFYDADNGKEWLDAVDRAGLNI